MELPEHMPVPDGAWVAGAAATLPPAAREKWANEQSTGAAPRFQDSLSSPAIQNYELEEVEKKRGL